MTLAEPLVLTGFMGSGKSTVGRLVAERLALPFVDLDAHIERLAGQPIAALFAAGEATFRQWERRALQALPLDAPLVLATGGGTLVGQGNVQRLAGLPVAVLDVTLQEAQARVAHDGPRPLAPALAALWQRRAAAYGRLPGHVATVNRSPDAIAAEIVAQALAGAARLPAPGPVARLTVPTPGGAPYPIEVGEGVAARVGEVVAALGPGHVLLVTDEQVGPLWGETVRHDLLAAGLPTTLVELPPGEAHKSLETLGWLYERFQDAGLDRSGSVVALGGGVVGDLAGFAAATWMRGTRGFVQLPTTLLAMVDASLGGKTGVDLPRGKNLVGAFRHPDAVLTDPTFLATLPPRELRSGMAEVVKHALIAGPALWAELEAALGGAARSEAATSQALRAHIPPLLPRLIAVKAELVARDPWEHGERALLNLGHTFGHAYELMSGFALSHGEAVSVGMVTAARLSVALGWAAPSLAARLEALLTAIGLPTQWPGAADGAAVWAAMGSDKKKAAQGLRFVLPRALGDVVVSEPGALPRERVVALLEAQHQP